MCVTACVAAMGLACKGGSGPARGTVGGDCFPNGTCNDGLVCLSQLCVAPVDAAPVGILGQHCQGDDACVSGICLDVGVCSETCASADTCPQFDNWTCAPLADKGDVCQCEVLAPETCSMAPLDRECDAAADEIEDCPELAESLAPIDDVDILFVIDNSGSMAEEQYSLVTNFQRFVQMLESSGHLPGLHIGVISTDVGAGPFNISGCSGNGDNGVLQSAPRSACEPPLGAFISDVPDGVGGRVTNYSGTLADVFACIASLGIDGCGFEQPLESLRRALNDSNPSNAGFLRPAAALAVVILSDEDDCSTADTSMFDTSQNSVSDPLGPLASFRCFEFGVVCQPDIPRTPGPRSNCVPRDDSAYMYKVDDYVNFVKGLKPDPSMVMVAGIIGNPTPVTVGLNDQDEPKLESSCVSAAGEAVPAVRIAHFLAQFPERNAVTTICSEDLSDALDLIGGVLAEGIGGPCLFGTPRDVDAATAGLQTDCVVADVASFGAPDETVVQAIPACAGTAPPAPVPCWHLEEDAAECPGTAHHLLAVVERGGGSAPPGTLPVIRCTAEPGR